MKANINELRARHAALKQERLGWEADWKLLAEHFLPRRCRLEGEAEGVYKGGLRGGKLDSTAFYAMRDLAAGLHGGLTSPARPWFNLSLQDQELARLSSVRRWLDQVTRRMRFTYEKSNFYNAISVFYSELATFGTAFIFALEDDRSVLRFVPLTAGEYCLDTDASGRVDTVFRTMSMTLRQLVQEFGAAALPEHLREMSGEPRNWNQSFQVVHAVYPAAGAEKRAERPDYAAEDSNGFSGGFPGALPEESADTVAQSAPEGRGTASSGRGSGRGDAVPPPDTPYTPESANLAGEMGEEPRMAYASVYYLDGFGREAPLRESGFHEFPGFGVRWDVVGNDVYGKGPAADTLADSILLQQMTRSMLQAIQLELNPPLQSPAGFENVSLLPGAVNAVSQMQSGPGIRPILELRHNIEGTYRVIAQVQDKVREGLFNNLFRMLLNSDRRQITAREVAAREQEKLILIGPVLERLNDEFFIPVSDRVFNILLRQGMIPPWPTELEGREISVEFVSMLAQAQKLVATGAVEQFASFVGNMAGMYPEALDSVNVDNMVDNYAEYLGVEANMLKGLEERERIRAGRYEAQAAQAQAAQAGAAADMVKKLGSSGIDIESVLNASLSGMGPGTAQGAGAGNGGPELTG